MNLDQREILDILRRPVDVRRLMNRLAFDAEDFDRANMEQPRLSLEAGRYRTQAALDRARLELMLETAEAQFRESLVLGKQKKAYTEKAIAGKMVLDPDIRRMRKRLYLAEATETWAKQLAEAYQYQRLSVLKVIGDIRASEIASELRSVKEKAAIDVVRRAAERVRDQYEGE